MTRFIYVSLLVFVASIQSVQAGWVEDISDYIQCLYDTFIAWLGDFAVSVFRGIMEAIAAVITAIPIPSELATGLSSYYAEIDPGILYFLSQSGVPEALGILGVGMTFRLTRKLVTLGRW